jgi:RHS repeat-associated protein
MQETTFVWDWATGVPEMLEKRTTFLSMALDHALFVVGHDTLGWQSGTEWTFVLPDALGSVRQETDVTGAVTAAREWTPYGGEVGGAQAGLGFTGEWFDGAVGLQYLRARWLDVGTGRFTQVDPWAGNLSHPRTLNGFTYANANPVRFVDPSGLCIPGEPDYDDCMRLAELLARAYGLSVDSRPDTFQEKFAFTSSLPYDELQDLWETTDPLASQRRYAIVKQEAARFGLPPEFVAAVIAAEVEYDTNLINHFTNVWTTALDWAHADHPGISFLFSPFIAPCISGYAQIHLEEWHYYYGGAFVYLNPEHGFGEGPAPGIGNIHAGVATDTEQYFAENYPDEDLLPIAASSGRRLELLRRFEWNVRYVAGHLRMLADLRTNVKGAHPNLTDTDMKMIFTAYHADLGFCFLRKGERDDPIHKYQQATHAVEAACDTYANQLESFLELYRFTNR